MSKRKPAIAMTREALLDAGEHHFFEGDYDAALACFDRAIVGSPEDVEAHYLRARALFYLQRDEEAEASYDRALELAPNYAPALIHKAELLVRSYGWPEDALELLDDADATELGREDEVEAAFVRGMALMERAEYRAALDPLNRAVRGDGDWAEAMRERAICSFYLWQFDDSVRDLERVTQLDAGDAEAYFFLAMAYERVGRAEEARNAYERASELDPGSFHTPCRVSREEFARAANDALDELPEEFRVRFDNVSLAIEDLPAEEEVLQPDVQGMFDGRSIRERRPGTSAALPCRVRLFQKNIERMAPDLPTLKEEIGKTVLHEVGNFFGMYDVDYTNLSVH